MRRIVEAVFQRLSLESMTPDLEALAKEEAELRSIEKKLDEARDEVPFLDKVNIFKTTDAEREVKRHKAERAKVREEARRIQDRLRAEIRAAVAAEPAAQIAIRLSGLGASVETAEKRVEKLGIERPKNAREGVEIDTSHLRVAGLQEMRESVAGCRTALNDLKRVLRDKADIDTDDVNEETMITATMDRLRRGAGVGI